MGGKKTKIDIKVKPKVSKNGGKKPHKMEGGDPGLLSAKILISVNRTNKGKTNKK